MLAGALEDLDRPGRVAEREEQLHGVVDLSCA